MATNRYIKQSGRATNNLLGVGVVVSHPKYLEMESGTLASKVRIKTKGEWGEDAYMDVYGFGSTSHLMHLLCRRGNTVTFDCSLTNRRLPNSDDVRLLIVARSFELVTVPDKPNLGEISEMMNILDVLHPEEMVNFDEDKGEM